VSDISEAFVDRPKGAAYGSSDAHDALGGRAVEMSAVVPGDHEDLIRRTAPVGAERHGVVGGLHDPVVDSLFGSSSRAHQAAASETVEAGLLLGKLPWHERYAEQLAVRVGYRGARLASVVDDHLAVAQARGALVLADAVADGEHDQGHLL